MIKHPQVDTCLSMDPHLFRGPQKSRIQPLDLLVNLSIEPWLYAPKRLSGYVDYLCCVPLLSYKHLDLPWSCGYFLSSCGSSSDQLP